MSNYKETITLLYYDADGDDNLESMEEGPDYFARGHIPSGSWKVTLAAERLMF